MTTSVRLYRRTWKSTTTTLVRQEEKLNESRAADLDAHPERRLHEGVDLLAETWHADTGALSTTVSWRRSRSVAPSRSSTFALLEIGWEPEGVLAPAPSRELNSRDVDGLPPSDKDYAKIWGHLGRPRSRALSAVLRHHLRARSGRCRAPDRRSRPCPARGRSRGRHREYTEPVIPRILRRGSRCTQRHRSAARWRPRSACSASPQPHSTA